MPQSPVSNVVRFARQMLAAHRTRQQTDSSLLLQFREQRDEAAFTELVRRHGPVVHGVCLRVLADLHDAEDVFQATFLVLARKAGTIRKSASVKSWLYGVAYRLAVRLKADVARRRKYEGPAATALVPD